jgi:Ca-activated chloride channel family protein
MKQQGRLEAARRGLLELVGRLGPGDRVSLITFSDFASTAFDTQEGDLERVRRAVLDIQPRRATNLAAGLLTACAKALDGGSDANMHHQLVVLTDGWFDLSDEATGRIGQLLRGAADQGVNVSFLDLDGQSETNAVLAGLARAASGSYTKTSGTDALRRRLVESLSGRRQILAERARLHIDLNPEAVRSYRIVGHEASEFGGMLAGAVETDVFAGETATVLLEVELLDDASNHVADTVLTWREPGTTTVHRLSQKVSRIQFATSFAGSPISLQAATLAAETAELLRGSVYVQQRDRSLAAVLRQAEAANPKLVATPQFQRLLRIARIAESRKLDRRKPN